MPDKKEGTREELQEHWNSFCDGDRYVDGFIERMEAAGYAELRAVTDDDLETSFACERGIERGGNIWVLTEKGQIAFREAA